MGKIVINKCFGFFGISQKARALYKDRAGVEFNAIKTKRSDVVLVEIIKQLGEEANTKLNELELVDVDGYYKIISESGIEKVEHV